MPALLGLVALQPAGLAQALASLTEDEETVLRVPVQPRPLDAPVEWAERKGPSCIPLRAIRRAMLSGNEQVDFLLGDRFRVRAEFDERCPALDFYGGFYLKTEDQRLCAGRDAVRSRMGGDCTIERFKHLVPKVNR
uniref:hypothetical protein n=1 Tax=uncultured Sphingomonas sp. TaxID=158754 RepID=UPI0025DF061E|nr:hypothetical protein [uncultured Sphingomonas sp.]